MDSAIDPTVRNADIPSGELKAGEQVGSNKEAREATLEDEVKELVGNVSSWWTGFSKRVSGPDLDLHTHCTDD